MILAHVADLSLRHQTAKDHSSELDHEQFLGKDMSHELDGLPVEEVKSRLGKLFDKIDTNKDGKLDIKEMTAWMRNLTKRYIHEDVERYWQDQSIPEGHKMTWEMYKAIYNAENGEEDSETMKKILEKDEKRWRIADLDGDEELDKDELSAFLHPEEYEHTRPIVAQELIDEIDLDKDGFVSEEEYMKDMGFNLHDPQQDEHRQTELKNFREKRDKDHDNKLNFDEVTDWLAPSPEKYALEEAEHLLSEADDDKDGFISKDELLKHHDVFAGSQVTDYGDYLRSHRDEL